MRGSSVSAALAPALMRSQSRREIIFVLFIDSL
jgi:hypothetical protein